MSLIRFSLSTKVSSVYFWQHLGVWPVHVLVYSYNLYLAYDLRLGLRRPYPSQLPAHLYIFINTVSASVSTSICCDVSVLTAFYILIKRICSSFDCVCVRERMRKWGTYEMVIKSLDSFSGTNVIWPLPPPSQPELFFLKNIWPHSSRFPEPC